MLSSVLHSKRAVRVNIETMRAFVRLRAMTASYTMLARKVDALERKYDAQFKGSRAFFAHRHDSKSIGVAAQCQLKT